MKKILVIEDDKWISESIFEILSLSGYEPILAKDGIEGVALYNERKPDFVFCDVMMPNLDGFGVLKELTRSQKLDVPFVFLTAKAQYNDLRMGMDMGADDYIFKPFKSADLLNAIKTRLSKKEQFKTNLLKKVNDPQTDENNQS